MGALAGAAALAALAVPPAGALSPPGSACPVFPADNAWHADVTSLPVHPSSDAWLASMGGPSRRLHPDFGPASPGEQPYGIPYVVVSGGQPKVPVAFEYADESDPGPYPLAADTPLEGGSDRHALIIDRDRCTLYELYATTFRPSGSTAGSGAIWDLRSNALRPASWTSADAAGLPIFPGLVRRDEVAAGAVDHAIRITAQRTDRTYVWPARHQAGAARDPSLPPMGARFRLKSGVSLVAFRPDTQAVLRAMQRYGVIVADNGSNWYFTGTSEQGWDTAMLDELKSVPAGQFEAVDASSLMVDPNSGQVRGAPAAAPATTAAPATAPSTTRATAPPTTRAPVTAPRTAPAPTTTSPPPPTTAPPQSTTTAPATVPPPVVEVASRQPADTRPAGGGGGYARLAWLLGLSVALAATTCGILALVTRLRRPPPPSRPLPPA